MDSKSLFKKAVNLLTLSSFLLWNLAAAAPEGGSVAQGSATISQSGAQTTINQTSQNAVINWNSFNTASHEAVQFNQPNSSAVALNRITNGLPTEFAGQLNANGQVWILNPAGVLFTSTAKVDVAGLVATTHGILDSNFMAGNYKFDLVPGFENANIINNGLISAKDSGIVALVAPHVANNGLIQVNLGRVSLASGAAYTLDMYGDNLINFGSNVPIQNGSVSNAGKIIADGGKVYMTANSAAGVLDNVISMSGTVQAKSVSVNKKGEIVLYSNSGVTKVTGKLNTSSIDGNRGGFIETSGATLIIGSEAEINAGVGGTWLLDPLTINLSSYGSTVQNILNAGTNVTLSTGVSGLTSGTGDINIDQALSWTTAAVLTLAANNDINISQNITATSGGGIILHADFGGTAGGTVIFSGGAKVNVTGPATIYYYPGTTPGTANYSTPTNFNADFLGTLPTVYMAIDSTADLATLASQSLIAGVNAANYHLSNNVTYSGTSAIFPTNASNNGFAGIFDGHNYVTGTNNTISGFNITGSAGTLPLAYNNWPTQSAFTGRLMSTGVVKDINFSGNMANNIASTAVVGGVAGLSEGTISNVTYTGTVNTIAQQLIYQGGIAGIVASGGILSYVTFSGTVQDSGAFGAFGSVIGGLVGQIQNGSISFSSVAAGSSVIGSHSMDHIGGMVGNIDGTTGTISNSYSQATVGGTSRMSGGIVAVASAGALTLTNVYNSGSVTGSVFGNSENGAIIGHDYTGAAVKTNTYYNSTNCPGCSTTYGGSALTTVQMQNQASFVGYNFANIWMMSASSPFFPVLIPTANTTSYNTVLGLGNLSSPSAQNIAIYINGTLYSTVTSLSSGIYAFIYNPDLFGTQTFLATTNSTVKGAQLETMNVTGPSFISGLDITNNLVRVDDQAGVGTLSNSDLAVASGATTPYSNSGNNLTLNSGISFSTTSVTDYNLNGGITTSGTGGMTFSGPVTLGATLTLLATGAGNIVFADTLEGAFGLTINSVSGNVEFDNNVGGTPLSSLTVSAGNLIIVNPNANAHTVLNIITSGNQTYNGNIRLSPNTIAFSPNVATDAFQSTAGDITFNGTVTLSSGVGNIRLLMNAGNNIHINGALLMDPTPFTSYSGGTIDFTAGNKIYINTTTINLGNQPYVSNFFFSGYVYSPILLQQDLVITASQNGYLNLLSTFDTDPSSLVPHSLTMNVNGLLDMFGSIGASNPLSSITAGSVVVRFQGLSNPLQFVTTGNQTYTQTFFSSFYPGITFNQPMITFTSTGNGLISLIGGIASFQPNSSVQINGNAYLQGNNFSNPNFFVNTVGGSLGITVTGDTEMNNVIFASRAGNQIYQGNVTITDNDAILSTTSGHIEFRGNVNSAIGNNSAALTLSTPSGYTQFGGIVNVATGTDPLASLTMSNPIRFNGSTFNVNNFTFASAIGITSLGGIINPNTTATFNNTINGVAVGNSGALTINGNAEFNANVGGTTPLASLYVSGTTTGATVTTVGNQDYIGAFILTQDDTLISTAGSIHFYDTVDGDGNGPWDLTVNAANTVLLDNNVGSTFVLDNLNVTALNGIYFNTPANPIMNIITAGVQTYTGNLVFSVNGLASSVVQYYLTAGGDITVNNQITAPNALISGLDLFINASGNVFLKDDVLLNPANTGVFNRGGYLDVTAAGDIYLGTFGGVGSMLIQTANVSTPTSGTSQSLIFRSPILLDQDVTFNMNSAAGVFDGTIDSDYINHPGSAFDLAFTGTSYYLNINAPMGSLGKLQSVSADSNNFGVNVGTQSQDNNLFPGIPNFSVTTVADQTYLTSLFMYVAFGGTVLFKSDTGTITFTETDGLHALAVSGGCIFVCPTTFNGNVVLNGDAVIHGSLLALNGSVTLNNAMIMTDASQEYDGTLILNGANNVLNATNINQVTASNVYFAPGSIIDGQGNDLTILMAQTGAFNSFRNTAIFDNTMASSIGTLDITGDRVTQSAGAVLTANTLITDTNVGMDLSLGTNTIQNFSATNGTGVSGQSEDDINLTNTGSPLTILGITQNGNNTFISNDVNINNTGSIVVTGAITATVPNNTVFLTSTGSITQSSLGVVNVYELMTNSNTGTDLTTAANTISYFNATNNVSGDISLENTAAPLNITGIAQSGDNVLIDNTGSITFNGNISAPNNTVTLNTTGSVSKGFPGAITADTLIVNAVSGISLSGMTDNINNVSATNTTSGAVSLFNSPALNILGITQSGGNLVIFNFSGAITQTGAISVSGMSTFVANGNPIDLATNGLFNNFQGAVSLSTTGANDVTIYNNNDLILGTFSGISIGRDLTATVSSGNNIILQQDITTGGVQTYNSPVIINNSFLSLSATDITFASTVDDISSGSAFLFIDASGVVTANGDIGVTTPLGYIQVISPTMNFNASEIQTTDFQEYTTDLVLSQPTVTLRTVDSSGEIYIDNNIIGLTTDVIVSSNINFGVFGSFAPVNQLKSITVDTGMLTVFVQGSLTTTNDQTYGGQVILLDYGYGIPVTLESTAGSIIFNDIVGSDSSPIDLMIDGNLVANAVLGPNPVVGGAYAGADGTLNSLTVTGLATINATAIHTVDGQFYNGAVVLGSNTKLTVDNGISGQIIFGNTVSGAFALVIDPPAIVQFNGDVNIASLNVQATQEIQINTANILTSGDQLYDGPVVLGFNPGSTLTSSGGHITFNSTVDGGFALNLNTPGANKTINFNGIVGGITPLASLATAQSIDDSGSVNINTSAITTTGMQDYNNDSRVDLGVSAITLTGSTIRFGSAVMNESLPLHADLTIVGNLFLNIGSNMATIGAAGAINSLHVTGTTTILPFIGNVNTILTEQSQTYDQGIDFSADVNFVTLNGGKVWFKGAFQSTFGPWNITVNNNLLTSTPGIVQFDGAVLGVNNLMVIGSEIDINTTNIQTSGTQLYDGPVIIGENATLLSTAGTITFNNTLDDNASLTHSLTLNSTGFPVFNGAIGNNNPLLQLNILAPSLSPNVSQSSIVGGVLSVGTGVLMQATSTDVTVLSPITQTATTATLTLTAANNVIITSPITLTGSLVANAANQIQLGSNISTDINQIYNNSVIINNNTILTSTAGIITFANTLNDLSLHAHALTLITPSFPTFSGAVGSITPLSDLNFIEPSFNIAGSIQSLVSDQLNKGTNVSMVTTSGGNISSVSPFFLALTPNGGNLYLEGEGVDLNPGNEIWGNFHVKARSTSINFVDTGLGGGGTVNGTILFEGDLTHSGNQLVNYQSGGAFTLLGNINMTGIGDFYLTAYSDVSIFGNVNSNGAVRIFTANAVPHAILINGSVTLNPSGGYFTVYGLSGSQDPTSIFINGPVSVGAIFKLIAKGNITIMGNTDSLYGGTISAYNGGSVDIEGNLTNLNVNGDGYHLDGYDILLNGTADGTGYLTFAATNSVTIQGNIGDILPYGRIDIDSPATYFNGTSIKTHISTDGYPNTFFYVERLIPSATIYFSQPVVTLTNTPSGGFYGNYIDAIINSPGTDLISNGDLYLGTYGVSTTINNTLKSLTVNGATDIISGTITTSGNQLYNGQVLLENTNNSATTLIAPSIVITGVTSSSSNTGVPADLILNGTTVQVSGEMGPTSIPSGLIDAGYNGILNSLTVNGPFTFSGSAITTINDQNFNNTVVLGSDTVLTSTSGGINFANTVDSDGTPRSLTLDAFLPVTLTGNIGSSPGGILSTLHIINETHINTGIINTTTSQLYDGIVILGANTILTTDLGGAITFGSTVDGGFDLTANAPSGTVGFNGDVGSSAPLNILTVTGATNINAAQMLTMDEQTYNSPVTLMTNVLFSSTGANVAFGDTLDGPFALTANAMGVGFSENVGGILPLSSIDISASFIVALENILSIQTTGTQTYNAPFVMGNNPLSMTFIATDLGSTVIFNQGLLTLNLGTSATIVGDTIFRGPFYPVTMPLQELGPIVVTGTTLLDGVTVQSSSQTYQGAVTITASNATLTSPSVEFDSTVEGPGGLIVNGDMLALDHMGFTIPLGYLTVNGTATGVNIISVGDINMGPFNVITNDVVQSLAGNVNFTSGPVTLFANLDVIAAEQIFFGAGANGVTGPFALSAQSLNPIYGPTGQGVTGTVNVASFTLGGPGGGHLSQNYPITESFVAGQGGSQAFANTLISPDFRSNGAIYCVNNFCALIPPVSPPTNIPPLEIFNIPTPVTCDGSGCSNLEMMIDNLVEAGVVSCGGIGGCGFGFMQAQDTNGVVRILMPGDVVYAGDKILKDENSCGCVKSLYTNKKVCMGPKNLGQVYKD